MLPTRVRTPKVSLASLRSSATRIIKYYPRQHVTYWTRSRSGSARAVSLEATRSSRNHLVSRTMSSSDATSVPPIVRFYSDPAGTKSTSLDPEGRSLEEIWKFSDAALERNHDYIQVLFPLPETSPFNPWAPHVDRATRDAFLADQTLRDRLLQSFNCMAKFYGFEYSDAQGAPRVEARQDFEAQARRNWLKRFDHNHLRISRIIRCLRVLGLGTTAAEFHRALVANASGVVSARSLMYWERAAQRPLHLPPDEDDEDARGVGFLRDA